MRILLMFFIYLFSPINGYCQEEKSHYDSLGRLQGYIKQPSFVNYINDNGFYNGVESYEYGNMVDNNRTGVWIHKDEKGELLAQKVYINDSTNLEIQYKNGKIFSILTFKIGPLQMVEGTLLRTAQEIEIISFDKKGRIRSIKNWRKGKGMD